MRFCFCLPFTNRSMRGVNLLTVHRKSLCCDTTGIAGYRKIYLFRNKAQYVNQKAVNPGFCEKWKILKYHLGDLRVPQVRNP